MNYISSSMKLAIILTHFFVFNLYASDCAKYERFRCDNNKSYDLHLTFDDGPHEVRTRQVLTALNKHGILATFFISANKVNDDSDYLVLDEITADGHQIGSHSLNHVLHTKLSDEQLYFNISESYRILRDYLTIPYLFRLPYGDGWHPKTVNPARAPYVMKAISDEGFEHMGWDIDADDWDARLRKNNLVFTELTKEICANQGGIVLLHDYQAHTAKNLSHWITGLKCVGHKFY